MRPLLKILAGGFVVFMSLSIIQEWEFFSTAWFGDDELEPEISEQDRKAAADTVYLTLNLVGHLYASGGDPRFAERMPASDSFIEEMMADIEYLARNHRRQDGELEHLDIIAIEALASGRLEIRTRERWRIRLLWMPGGQEAEPTRVHHSYAKYWVARDARGWRVEGWEVTTQEWEAEAAP